MNDRIAVPRLLMLTLVMIASLVGCGSDSNTPPAGPDESNGAKAASFIIGGTEFEIDLEKSSFVAAKDGPRDYLIDIEIFGDEKKLEKINVDYDASEWSWASYPPHFYIREFPAEKIYGTSKVAATASLGNAEYYEVAIYMMEHSDIDDVKIEIDDNSSLKITGNVDLFGKKHDFEINWKK